MKNAVRGKKGSVPYRDPVGLATIIFILSLYFLCYLAGERLQELASFDQKATAWVKALIPPSAAPAMFFFSLIGSAVPVSLFTAGIAFFCHRRKRNREATVVVTAVLGAFLLEELFKTIFRRPRPYLASFTGAHGYSFPSGHATVAAAMAVVLAWLWYRHARNRPSRWLGPVTGLFLSFFIGVSRVYLGAHYPSDVLAGFILGTAWGVMVAAFLLPPAAKE
ncbi:undecaprenyl-diphosphatase [Thermodesulfitimonas autotrophica]|uniref:Undecaprenyl-diphosphatase n=1 Tax=Thermodesulfitimonas autotrophica TaxID=1894989 RepID=A0A3N5AQ18_9THEO|nr:phosphatase PAP2 family protein [Thermodesulfitimonas autotrophica]RPF46947.1 undecaprenyl-diphosphatase [Thermodesulfitimonas autotrophica]